MKNHFDNNFRLHVTGSRATVITHEKEKGKVTKNTDDKQAAKETTEVPETTDQNVI